MKNSNYIINGIVIVAIIVLFILQFTGKRADIKQPETAEANANINGYHLPIAFVRTDSLLPNYKFFTDWNEVNMKNIEDKRLAISQRSDKLQKDIIDFQQKSQMNAFISKDRELQEQNRILSAQKSLEDFIAKVEQDLSLEQSKMQQQLIDTIVTALRQFNIPKKYEFILSNAGTDNILYADDEYDITKEVIEFLNARYVPSK